MNTKTKAKHKRTGGKVAVKPKAQPPQTLLLDGAETANISPDKIDFSPLNYRKYISEEALQKFAEELKPHGIISPLTVRPKGKGSYELVVGERRLRAARIAGLLTVPVSIVSLTDEQVIEIQLSENIQRENPHPMDEAKGIGQMQTNGKTIDEIATRLGKSKQFVYVRLKLLSLIEAFQEMVYENKISLQDALQIASLSTESQTEFFNEQCKNWKKQKNFSIHNLDYYLNHYRYDLKRAPFNTKDKTLIPDVGACTGCPSNSASLKTLFPEMAKTAVCSNRECYNNKCSVHFLAALNNAIATYQPVAFIYNNQLTEMVASIINLIPGAPELPRHNYHEISVIEKPEVPEKETYTYGQDDELDEDEYNEAMEDYTSQLEAYNLHTKSGHYQVAIFLDNKTFAPVYFSMEKPSQKHGGGQTVTAKEVQAAIKDGTATPDLIKAEIERIKQREKRAEELDNEKVQLTVHNLFSEFAAKPENNTGLTTADLTGARLIIFQSLDYSTKDKVRQALLKEKDKNKMADDNSKLLYQRLGNMTEQEYSYLVRMAMAGKSESKYPSQQAGYFLYQMATEAGIPVKTVEDAQGEKRKERKQKQQTKIKELEGKAKKLKTK